VTAAKKLETTSNLASAFAPYEGFCRAMLDAYAVVDMNGQVLKSNQMLAQLFGKTTKQILKAPCFDEFINLFINDRRLQISKMIDIPAATRLDEVRGEVPGRHSLNLILGVYPFFDEATKAQIGAFILLRDVTAETNLQFKYKDAANKSITDPLTGLFTRGYFEDYFGLQLRTMTALREDADQRNLSIIMVDIDFFKKVNDVHGHQAGDHILQEVANLMKKCFRKTDVICRYGGEEFLIILPSTDVTGALLAAEKMRSTIQTATVMFENTHIPLTISGGVAQVKVGQEDYPETIARADASLYEAKKSGRNRILLAKP